MGVLEHIKMTIICCTGTSPPIPGAALTPEPLQYLQVTALSCPRACLFIPRAALAPEPLQYIQIATFAGTVKDLSIQPEPLLGFQPLQDLQLASARCEEEKQRKKSEAETTKKKKLRRRREREVGD